MQTTRRADGRVERGERTRRQILDAAVDIASVDGLEGLSIGELAAKLRMSKSGLFAAFGSKEDLQLAAEQFDVLLTVDRNLEYQQSFAGLTIAVVVVDVPSNDIADIRPLMPAVLQALGNLKTGTVTHVHG